MSIIFQDDRLEFDSITCPEKLSSVFGHGALPCSGYVDFSNYDDLIESSYFNWWQGVVAFFNAHYHNANKRPFVRGVADVYIMEFARKNPDCLLYEAAFNYASDMLHKLPDDITPDGGFTRVGIGAMPLALIQLFVKIDLDTTPNTLTSQTVKRIWCWREYVYGYMSAYRTFNNNSTSLASWCKCCDAFFEVDAEFIMDILLMDVPLNIINSEKGVVSCVN